MKSGAEVLKNHCFLRVNQEINNNYKTFLDGMITGLQLNNIITPTEADAAKAIINAKWGGMHPLFADFYN